MNVEVMNRRVAAILLIVIVVGVGIVCYLIFGTPWDHWPESETTDVDMGIFYYAWYDGGYGNLHWSDRVEWAVVDEPVLGYYNSCET
jgi:hypothetical protein